MAERIQGSPDFELGLELAWDLFEQAADEHPERSNSETIEFARGVATAALQLLDDLRVGTDDLRVGIDA